MRYEPLDVLYWTTQPDSLHHAMGSHQPAITTTLMVLCSAPAFSYEQSEQFDIRAVQNYPTASLNGAYGAVAPLRANHQANKQFRIGQLILSSTKAL